MRKIIISIITIIFSTIPAVGVYAIDGIGNYSHDVIVNSVDNEPQDDASAPDTGRATLTNESILVSLATSIGAASLITIIFSVTRIIKKRKDERRQ